MDVSDTKLWKALNVEDRDLKKLQIGKASDASPLARGCRRWAGDVVSDRQKGYLANVG